MSLPTFPQIDPPLTREGSLNEIISSIAAEELSLSHILNAEGEKLQYVLGTLPGLASAATLDQVMQTNQSVQETLSSVMEQQMLLTGKLTSAMTAPILPGPTGPTGATRGRSYRFGGRDRSYRRYRDHWSPRAHWFNGVHRRDRPHWRGRSYWRHWSHRR